MMKPLNLYFFQKVYLEEKAVDSLEQIQDSYQLMIFQDGEGKNSLFTGNDLMSLFISFAAALIIDLFSASES